MSASATRDPGTVEPFRVCADCQRAKTIRGVWYIVPEPRGTPFMCETCFARTRPVLRAVR